MKKLLLRLSQMPKQSMMACCLLNEGNHAANRHIIAIVSLHSLQILYKFPVFALLSYRFSGSWHEIAARLKVLLYKR